MLYKFLTVLSIFSASFVFAVDLPMTGTKRERPAEPADIVNEQPPVKKTAIFLLHKACEEGDIEKVKELLITQDINEKDQNGNTPILAACAYGQADVVELLLGEDYIKYININDSNKQENSLLHLVCKKFKDEKAKQIIEKITAHQHICINHRNEQYDTALMIACCKNNLAAIKALLKHPNIKVNFSDKNSCTPLHIACINNKKEIVKEFLEHSDTDVNAKCNRKMCKIIEKEGLTDVGHHIDKLTPLHLACEFGNKKIVKLLLKNNKIKINKTTKTFGHTALSIAIVHSKPEIVKLLLQEKAIDIYASELSDEETPLDILMRTEEINSDHALIIKAFVDYQWSNIKNSDKKGLIHFYLKNNKANLVNLILQKNKESPSVQDGFEINEGDLLLHSCKGGPISAVEMLIEKFNVSVNSKDRYSNTPLHIACRQGNVELLNLLLKNNAEIDCKGDEGYTPLHYAVSYRFLEHTKILIDNNANVNSKNESNLTPLDMVLTSYSPSLNVNTKEDVKNLIEYLLNKGALYSENFNENENTKDLLEEIKSKMLENVKSIE